MNFKIVGTLDFLPKMGYPSLEGLGAEPVSLWWHTYLIKSDKKKVESLPSHFGMVDNLDSEGKWFVVKDSSHPKDQIFINEGYVPCIASDAEVTPPKSGRYVHVSKNVERAEICNKIEELKVLSDEVYMIASIYPTLEVYDYMTKE